MLAAADERDRLSVTAAIVQDVLVGAVVSAAAESGAGREILAIGVAPEHRGHGLASAMLEAHVASFRPGDESISATITVAERDPSNRSTTRSGRRSPAASSKAPASTSAPPAGRLRGVDPLALEATLG